MLFPIKHATWQQLRVLARAKGKPVLGRDIRIVPTRFTKSGEFLDELIEAGLIERAEGKPIAGNEPEQFRVRYTLTEKGRHAAEYGEYERVRQPQQTAG
ncbi:unnamed protein product [Gemmata massiliana]|uniref:Uncharacterized protein n=1 Tax=Gemmata massiliana TaxID=1210884 RepID=A0A6P2DN74_9BACT|nr:hypothetical protein [Gemmata massiliana]VTS03477.1 unnamed protein product [Gemmata massiliana]